MIVKLTMRPETIYSINPEVLVDEHLLTEAVIPDNIRLYLKQYITECKKDLCQTQRYSFEGAEKLLIEINKLIEGTFSKSRNSQIISQIEKIGAMKKKNIIDPIANKKRRNLHLESIENIYNHYKKNQAKTVINKSKGRTKKIIIDNADQYFDNFITGKHLTLDGVVDNRIENLFCMLDSAMKTSARDKRNKIKVEYRLKKNEHISIEAVTTTGKGDEIAHLTDLRAMRVINGYYYEKIKESYLQNNEIPDGYLSFNIDNLCKRMGLRNDNGNREVVRAMIRRLHSTEFRIEGANSTKFKKLFDGATKGTFKYITELLSAEELTKIDEDHELFEMKEKYYRVRLHGEIVKSLLGMESFISHPGLNREKSAIAQRINNWSKAVVGVRPATDKELVYSLDQFHDVVYPGAVSFSNFSRDLITLIKRDTTASENELAQWGEENSELTATIHGYTYKLIWSTEKYRFMIKREKRRLNVRSNPIIIIPMRDVTDEYVGDNSAHNKAIRQEKSQLGLIFDH